MKNCTDCKHAEWKRTASGKLHPSGAGFGAMCAIRAYRHFAVFGTLCE